MRTLLRRLSFVLFVSILLGLPSPVAASRTGGMPAATAQGAPTDLDAKAIEGLVDRTLRQVRGRQESDGSYGDAHTTARVLAAFGESHRAYRAGDGPFVDRALAWLVEHQDAKGRVGAADLGEERAKLTTLAALHAYQLFGEDVPARRAANYLGLANVRLVGQAKARQKDLPDDALLDRAALLVAAQQEAETKDVQEPLEVQAERLEELSAIGALLKQRAVPKASRNAQALPTFTAASREASVAAMQRGARFLLQAAENEGNDREGSGRWGFGGRPDPGITAMVLGALFALPEPRPEAVEAAAARGLDWLVSLQHEDGSIHAGQLANYVTSAAVLALSAADREQDREVIARARDFLVGLQADEGEGYGAGDRYYGGVGYGGDERPDLSNLQMALDALAAAGLDENDPAFTKALVFLQRCQNRSESNDIELVTDGDTIESGNDGGAAYAPGDSKAGFQALADGTRSPRSYGSMTYALLKGYLLAGLERDDPRVQAAFDWLQKNYTLDVNPGFEASSNPTAAYQGLYYYFLAMARALDLYGTETLVDAQGTEHAWRTELSGRLSAMQRRDGSWINDNAPRWYEGNPVLATAYALLTLGAALPEN